MALISRFLRDFSFLLSVTAAGLVVSTGLVDSSSTVALVWSLFSTLFASVDGTSVFFSADFPSVAEAVDDTTGAGVAVVDVSSLSFETVGDSTDGALASVNVGVVVSS